MQVVEPVQPEGQRLPQVRVGCLLTASASWSLAFLANATAVAASKTCTPGDVSDRMCMAIPVESMSAIRRAPMSCSRSMIRVMRLGRRGRDQLLALLNKVMDCG
jgi:hypothetical protein